MLTVRSKTSVLSINAPSVEMLVYVFHRKINYIQLLPGWLFRENPGNTPDTHLMSFANVFNHLSIVSDTNAVYMANVFYLRRV